jgi:hypothetical protein
MSDTAQAQPEHNAPPAARPKKTRRRPHRLGPYSSVGALAGLDGRTWEYLYVKKCRRELEEHIGGAPTMVQRQLIERASWLMLRLSMMDRRLAEDGGKFTSNDSTQYMAWSNGLSRTLILLDLTRGKGGKHPRFLRSRTALEALYSTPGSEQKTVADLVGDNP